MWGHLAHIWVWVCWSAGLSHVDAALAEVIRQCEHLWARVTSPVPEVTVCPKQDEAFIGESGEAQIRASCFLRYGPQESSGTPLGRPGTCLAAFEGSSLLAHSLQAGGTRMGNCFLMASAGELLYIPLCPLPPHPRSLHLHLGTGAL